jgi:hypothetical protein
MVAEKIIQQKLQLNTKKIKLKNILRHKLEDT